MLGKIYLAILCAISLVGCGTQTDDPEVQQCVGAGGIVIRSVLGQPNVSRLRL